MERETEAPRKQEMGSRFQSCEEGGPEGRPRSSRPASLTLIGLSPAGDLLGVLREASKSLASKGNFQRKETLPVSDIKHRTMSVP